MRMHLFLTYATLLICGLLGLQAQNMVPNPSFENFKNESKIQPLSYGGTVYIDLGLLNTSDWSTATATTPDNYYFVNEGIAHEGHSVGGIQCWKDNIEYLQVKLTEPMEAGATYLLRFQVRLRDNESLNIPMLGVHFSEAMVKFNTALVLDRIEPTAKFSLEMISAIPFHWNAMEVTYVAKGGEQFMTIGNFWPMEGTKTTMVANGLGIGYYFFDDFKLVKMPEPDPNMVEAMEAAAEREIVRSSDIQFVSSIEEVMIEGKRKIVLDDLNFGLDDIELNDEAKLTLAKVAIFLVKNPYVVIEISGHTDNIGTQAYNLILSQKRAGSVINYLKRLDTEEEKMKPKIYGSTKPIASNETEEGRARNRRVEIRILNYE